MQGNNKSVNRPSGQGIGLKYFRYSSFTLNCEVDSEKGSLSVLECFGCGFGFSMDKELVFG
jgi:hypothetical protein